MSIRTGMFIVMLALVPAAGCAQRYVLRMSNPEESSTVTLFEGGRDETEDDDRTTVIEDPARIAKVAAFFKSKADEFSLMNADAPRMPRCTVVFRNDSEERDRFWVDPTHIYMQTPAGEYFVCKVSPRESGDLVRIFRTAANSQSGAQGPSGTNVNSDE